MIDICIIWLLSSLKNNNKKKLTKQLDREK